MPTAPGNVLCMMFDLAVRHFVANWEAVPESLVQRVHRERVGGIPDERTRALLAEVLAYPGVPRTWHKASPSTPTVAVLPVTFVKRDQRFNVFSTVSTLGTPQDITVQEIRIECFFPAEPATESAARRLISASILVAQLTLLRPSKRL